MARPYLSLKHIKVRDQTNHCEFPSARPYNDLPIGSVLLHPSSRCAAWLITTTNYHLGNRGDIPSINQFDAERRQIIRINPINVTMDLVLRLVPICFPWHILLCPHIAVCREYRSTHR